MKNFRRITVLLLTAAFAATMFPALAAPRMAADGKSRVRTVEKTVAVDGRAVVLETTASDIEVVAGTGSEALLEVRLEYWSNNEEWMDAVESGFDVEVEERSGRVVFRPANPSKLADHLWKRRLFRRKTVSYNLEIRLAVPATTAVEIVNRYGDVSVADVGGPLKLANSSGDVEVRGTLGRTEIKNTYGPITVADCDGEFEIEGGSGKVVVERLTGDASVTNRYAETVVRGVFGSLVLDTGSSKLTVEDVRGVARLRGSYADAEVRDVGGILELEVSSGNVKVSGLGDRSEIKASYGKIDVEGVDGPLTVRSTSGKVQVRDVDGPVRIENSYGEVRVEDAAGGVEVRNTSGGVTLDRIGVRATIESSYDAVRVNDLDGDLRVTAKSAAVRADGVGGSAEITTSYGGVSLSRVGGAITVRNQSGRVEVRGLSGNALAAQHRIETSYAGIDFWWPEAATAPTFSLECSYCTMKNDFGAEVRESGSRRFAEAEGSGANVTLSAQSGSIALRKD